jgi:hypothetical protein
VLPIEKEIFKEGGSLGRISAVQDVWKWTISGPRGGEPITKWITLDI